MSTGAGTGGGAGGGAAAASGGGGSTAASGGDSAGGAGGSGSPTRMVLIYTPHGTQPDWAPSGSGQSFTLSTILQPFESIKSQLLVIAGLDLPPPPTGISTHQTGSASLLTGSFGSCDSIQDECFAGGPSLDELVGSSDTPFYSLALAANIVGGPASHITYNAVDAPAIPETNPQTIVDQVFSNINESESSPEIDALIAKAGTLTPSSPLDQLSGFLFGVVREALALDLTRVAVVQLGCHTPTFVPSWLGFNDDYHQITHGSDSMSMAAVEAVQSWFASEIADFANKLAQRSLLDNTVIVWLSDMGSPPMAHSNQDIPVVIVGDANGRLKSGQFLQLDRNHVDLLLTLGQLMDPNLTTFGDPSLASAPIVEIVTP